jgi:uncharacterized metal-binding protein
MTIFVYGLYSDLLNYCFMHSENSRGIHFVIGQYICVYSVICRVEVVLVPKENASNLVEIPKKNVLRLNQN